MRDDQPTSAPADLRVLGLANRILEIGLTSHELDDLADVVAEIVALILDEMDYPYAGVGLLDEGGTLVRRFMGMDRSGDVERGTLELPVGEGVAGYVAQTGRTVLIDDVRRDSRYHELHADSRSELCVPLRVRGQVVGVLNLESPEAGRFDASDRALVEALSTPVAQAIHTARSMIAMRRLNERLDLLNHVSRIISGTADLDELMSAVVAAVRRRMGTALVAIGLVDEGERHVQLCAVDAQWPVALEIGHLQPLGEGVVGHALAEHAGLLIPDVRRFEPYVAAHPDVRCEMCCPMRLGDRIVGYLDAESTAVGAFDDADLALLQTIADHIAQAVVTARNQRQMEQLRADLSAMVIHDLRGPLTVVTTAVDLAGEYLSAPDPPAGRADDVASLMVRAGSAGEELQVLIDGLLQVQRLESGTWGIERAPCDLADLARRVVERMDVVAGARNIALEMEAEPALPRVSADHTLIARVLDNLLLNAFKAAGGGGHVRVLVGQESADDLARWRSDGAALVLAVQDDGPGIPERDRQRIFDKFAILGTEQSSRRRSTGLGLAFCRLAMSAHGGDIWVGDEPSGGAVFTALLPVDPVDPR